MDYTKYSIKCDCCTIMIGPKYITRDFFDVGPQKVCPFCYPRLEKNGYALLEEDKDKFKVMLTDGTIKNLVI